MHSPGESLKQEREARGKSIEEMAAATGIRPDLLTALEQEAFDSLPGRGFGKLYIRAYAEVLGFDPRPVIEAYDGAVRGRPGAESLPEPEGASRPVNAVLARWRQELMAGRPDADFSEEPEEEFEPVAVLQNPAPEAVPLSADPSGELIEAAPAVSRLEQAVSPSSRVRSRRWLQAALLPLVLLPLVAWSVFRRSTPDSPPATARPQSVPGQAIAPPPSRTSLPRVAEAPRTPDRTESPQSDPSAPGSLKVAESGVGLRLVGTRLEGEGDRFRAGQRVTFATRIIGGGDGESIRHVWLRDGKVEQSIGLRLGGTSWRTHSTKTLGRPGAWVVEARDEQGRVLARADLTVVP